MTAAIVLRMPEYAQPLEDQGKDHLAEMGQEFPIQDTSP
jgi:hypothetical protein